MTVHWRPSFVFLVVLTQEMQCSRGLADADNSQRGPSVCGSGGFGPPSTPAFYGALPVCSAQSLSQLSGGAGMLMMG